MQKVDSKHPFIEINKNSLIVEQNCVTNPIDKLFK